MPQHSPRFDGQLAHTVAFPTGSVPTLEKIVKLLAEELIDTLRGQGEVAENLGQITVANLLNRPVWTSQLVRRAAGCTSTVVSPPVEPSAERCGGLPLVSGAHARALGDESDARELSELERRQASSTLQSARSLLASVWPEAALEVSYLARGLVLAGSVEPNRMSSGTSPLSPFIVRLEMHPSAWPPAVADSLVHECAHIKLRLAMRTTEFCCDDDVARYRHPWRSDPRPLRALLIAAHAFVAVHRFYACLVAAEPGSDRALRYEAELRTQVAEVLGELASQAYDKLTSNGSSLLRCLDAEFLRSCAAVERAIVAPTAV